MKPQILICSCHSTEHQLIFQKDDIDEVYISVHLHKYRFWKRLWIGIRYIFGYSCRYGNFDEIITTKKELQEIIDTL